MPRQMTVVFPMEVIIMPGTTYMALSRATYPPHLHGRARLAEGSGAVVRGLFDRQVVGY
jgi:hypothetical protein